MTDVEIVGPAAEMTPTPDAEPAKFTGGPRFNDQRDLLNTLHTLADAIQDAKGLVPDTFLKKPGSILACFLTGAEWGIGPMTSLNHIAVDNKGRRHISAALQLAMVRRAGHHVSGSADDQSARVVGRRADNDDEIAVEWNLEKALAAGLIDRISEDGRAVARSSSGNALPWELYPQRMLWARAVTDLTKMLFSDVMIGGLPTEMGSEIDR